MPREKNALNIIFEKTAAENAIKINLLKKLVKAQSDLLVCYRLGKHPTGKLLDDLHMLKEKTSAY